MRHNDRLVRFRGTQVPYSDDPARYAEYDAADYLILGTSAEFYPGWHVGGDAGEHDEHHEHHAPNSAGDGGAAARGKGPAQWLGMSGDPRHPHRARGSRMLNSLKPRAAVTARVRSLPAFTVGVHVRGTDHVNSWHSPLPLFFKAMEARLDRDARSRFFVATDEPGIEKAIRDRYGDLPYYDPCGNEARGLG